jgi:hypothetical protein
MGGVDFFGEGLDIGAGNMLTHVSKENGMHESADSGFRAFPQTRPAPGRRVLPLMSMGMR